MPEKCMVCGRTAKELEEDGWNGEREPGIYQHQEIQKCGKCIEEFEGKGFDMNSLEIDSREKSSEVRSGTSDYLDVINSGQKA